MKKYLFTFLISSLIVNAADKGRQQLPTINVTNGSQQNTTIHLFYPTDYVNKECNFEKIRDELRNMHNADKQFEFLGNIYKERNCNIEDLGFLEKNDTTQVWKSVGKMAKIGILIQNKHGVIACKPDSNIAIRTAGKSKLLGKLTGGRLSRGSEIYCDYDPESSGIAEKKQLSPAALRRLREKEFSKENLDR